MTVLESYNVDRDGWRWQFDLFEERLEIVGRKASERSERTIELRDLDPRPRRDTIRRLVKNRDLAALLAIILGAIVSAGIYWKIDRSGTESAVVSMFGGLACGVVTFPWFRDRLRQTVIETTVTFRSLRDVSFFEIWNVGGAAT